MLQINTKGKRNIFLVILLSAGWCVQGSAAADHFCYNDEEHCGPSNWDGACNSGNQQSPIDLKFTSSDVEEAIEDDLYTNNEYGRIQEFVMDNNGHTAQAALRKDLTSRSTIKGKFLRGQDYVFSQLHFHWGSANGSGSEHSVNQKFYDMEGHLVHYRSDFSSLGDAVSSGEMGAVTVIGVFFKVSDRENEGLEPVLEAMENTKRSGQTARGEGLSLPAIFSSDRFNVIQYEGSLTTPGCAEVVLWNLVEEVNHISAEQMNKFRSLKGDEDTPLTNNYRPLQDLNGREFTYYSVRLNVS